MLGRFLCKVSEAVEKIIKKNEVCLAIGGDHSMSVGTIHGHLLAQPDTVLVWVDAHADINPPLVSTSGNFHGMVLSFLLHELQDYIPEMPVFDWLKPW
jgi:arginase